ncbi:TrkH family potassium uptake protein [Teredinibacter sp. KSP-S5-2]|uniref:TrkH family potassium uptake protein n=1 Tax=Teredinibacter sp. KSP-S5-2 TaxID=3034506 RepID=UPI0029340EBF|nr:potassium transporter TrkG [Teredinibacter sp. KSP-S5-2]WNO07932.1 potassium transporter TrkG [Teredinibacter sp. KSP-S5-2]
MINRKITSYLLAFPIALMGGVQLVFGVLSLTVFHDQVGVEFLTPALAALVCALSLFALKNKISVTEIRAREALAYAALTWFVMGVVGGIPIMLITHVSFTDAVFESISALTTTGATILSNLDSMAPTFLMYRQFLQWLGGLGIVIFVVAVLPMLNIGGMKLLKAETPGPIKDEKLSPRVANTTHYLWGVYFAITGLCALSYYVCGMSAFDAIGHSFTTVSTGGFSTHDASMGYFDSQAMLVVSDIFMVLGAMSFALHFRVWRNWNFSEYWEDEETRTFILVILAISALIAVFLYWDHRYQDPWTTFNEACFHLVSFITSTGYAADSFTEWPHVTAFLLVVSGYLGGCAGSTAGGNKFIRNILTFKIINLEMKRLVNPNAVLRIKYHGNSVDDSVMSATTAFMFFVVLSSLFVTLLLMMTGLEFWSSFTATAACLNVLGPAFGELGSNFQPVNDFGTWVLSGAMILGRLEYLTVLALFLPRFWRF